jgi:hypothetical protein
LNPSLVSGLGLDTEKAVTDGDETGLDGLPHAHFVCEQDQRHDPPRHLRSDAELMRKEIDASVQKAAHL